MFLFVIREIREKNNITLYKLKKITKLSYSYLSELENNKVFNPSLDTMYRIARALHCNIDDLIIGELDIEKLREEMHSKIDEFGRNSKEVMEASQRLDLALNLKIEKEKD